jgi:hypothetical protein
MILGVSEKKKKDYGRWLVFLIFLEQGTFFFVFFFIFYFLFLLLSFTSFL